MKTILITGGTGFVGRHVVRALSKFDNKLRLVVRKGSNLAFGLNNFPIEIIETEDLFSESSDWWTERCKGIDTVVHLAWYVEPGKYLTSINNVDCLSGSLKLAKGAAQAGIRRFVGIGTCFEYDLTLGRLSTATPLKPKTPYAATKTALFISLSHMLPLLAVEFVWCRLFYLFGESEDPRRLVPYVRSQLAMGKPAELTSGNQIRDFLDVTDAGSMIADATLSDQTGPVHIASGTPITVRCLAEQIADEYGRRDLLRFGVRATYPFDPPCVISATPYLRRNHESKV